MDSKLATVRFASGQEFSDVVLEKSTAFPDCEKGVLFFQTVCEEAVQYASAPGLLS
jgi:hypothetical protein